MFDELAKLNKDDYTIKTKVVEGLETPEPRQIDFEMKEILAQSRSEKDAHNVLYKLQLERFQ